MVSDKNIYNLLAKIKTRKSEAWQQKVDYVVLSEAVKSRLVRLFYIRTDVT